MGEERRREVEEVDIDIEKGRQIWFEEVGHQILSKLTPGSV